MIIQLPEEPLIKCKESIRELMKQQSKFQEIGGYLIGTYNGDFKIAEFIIDRNAESTATRIKLSAECFQKVEESLAKAPYLFYIGTWHVHPGAIKPTFSSIDQSTLFLEKLVIETDNPKEFKCPRIHLIFSEDLAQISAFTMQIQLNFQLSDYWTIEKPITQSEIDIIDNILIKLQNIKDYFKIYEKNKTGEPIENSFSQLISIREDLDILLDIIEDISEYQDISSILKKEKDRIEKQIISLIKKGETLGILSLNEDQEINCFPYRPVLIKDFQENGTLLGFWRHYEITCPSIELQTIFFANFFRKIEEESSASFIYISSDPSGIKFFNLKLLEFDGISFEEVTIILEEEK